jgi:hypothetical protein
MESIGSFEAKIHLPQLLERVAQGEEFTITKHGYPMEGRNQGRFRARLLRDNVMVLQ